MPVPRLVPAALLALGAQAASAQPEGVPDVDVSVELDQFGVGDAFRPGEITAIRLTLTSRMSESTSCWVQWEVPNAEGDIGEYGRTVSLGAGARASVWLYAPIPSTATSQSLWSVRVFEEREGERRRELGGARISPAGATPHSLETGLIAIVGRARMRLDDFLNPWTASANPPGAHEETRTVNLLPQEMPDRWEGLSPFEAVVWSDAPPDQLRSDAATALRDYVRRGGQLVIVLPDAGNPWGLGASGQSWLEDLLPRQAPRRVEGVKLSALMPLLSKSREPPPRDIELSIRVFAEFGEPEPALTNRYEPLMALPDGRVVVVQRIVAFGRITLIGIDLASQQLASMRLPQGDAFWNRVLGRRADTPSPEEVQQTHKLQRLRSGGRGDAVPIDGHMLQRNVNRPGRAEGGLAGALLLFAAYFIVAFASFPALKTRRLAQHSWLAFAGASALFTAVAWGGVRLMRQKSTEYRHVTFLDHVVPPAGNDAAGEPNYQRATSWGSLFIPGYGKVRVDVQSDPMQRDLLTTWAAPEKEPDRFPNVDRYRVDMARSPAEYEIPSRATAAQVRVDWMGALDPDWGGTFRIDPADPVRVESEPLRRPRLRGTLTSDLPVALDDLWIIWVTDRRAPPREYAWAGKTDLPFVPPNRSGEMLNTGHMWKMDASRPWHPGVPRSLTELAVPTADTDLRNGIDRRFIQSLDSLLYDPVLGKSPPDTDQMAMLSFFHQLEPPGYVLSQDKEPEAIVVSRRLGRGLDLSPWFNRPCLILIGFLPETPAPVPLLVDGDEPRSAGMTVVRWICPLPASEGEILASVDRSQRSAPEAVPPAPESQPEPPAPAPGRRNRR
jgi:hypothetical protein